VVLCVPTKESGGGQGRGWGGGGGMGGKGGKNGVKTFGLKRLGSVLFIGADRTGGEKGG